MSIASPPHVSLAEWETTWSLAEDAYELVAGVPTMTPPEAVPNLVAAALVYDMLKPRLRSSHRALWNCGVQLLRHDSRDTVRQPDLLVLPGTAAFQGKSVAARDVALVVEVVSPSSIERDWVTKRAEYAAAGIPNYLIIDVRSADGPRLWLFDQLLPTDEGSEPGAATTYRYADPTGDGTHVTIRIPGHDPITITAADLVD